MATRICFLAKCGNCKIKGARIGQWSPLSYRWVPTTAWVESPSNLALKNRMRLFVLRFMLHFTFIFIFFPFVINSNTIVIIKKVIGYGFMNLIEGNLGQRSGPFTTKFLVYLGHFLQHSKFNSHHSNLIIYNLNLIPNIFRRY